MLRLLDVLLTILHIVIILFNLFGWLWVKAKRANFVCLILTACSWFVLGLWKGMGYCPITHWQWQVKRKLGETNLPNSFITYYGEKLTGAHLNPLYVDAITAGAFAVMVSCSVYVNFFIKTNKEKQKVRS